MTAFIRLRSGPLRATYAILVVAAGIVFGADVCEALFHKAFALTDLGRKEEALSTLERLTSLAPMHAHYFVELGYAYRINGRLEKAREAYEKAVGATELSSDKNAAKLIRASGRRGLGSLLIDDNDLDGAEKLFRKSLEDDPESRIAKSELEFIASKRKERNKSTS